MADMTTGFSQGPQGSYSPWAIMASEMILKAAMSFPAMRS